MHNRKQYIVYPPNYQPLDGKYKVVYSKRQAWKRANKIGCIVVEHINSHPKPFMTWTSSIGKNSWEIYE